MAQPSVGGLALHVPASFGVEQNRTDDRGEVAACSGAATEQRADALDVTGRRVAGDKVLNQLLRDERRDVRTVGDVVNRIVQVLLRSLTGCDGEPVEEDFRVGI